MCARRTRRCAETQTLMPHRQHCQHQRLPTHPSNGPYDVSKFGIDALSQTLMEELRGSGICVSCVYLGVTKTNIARHARYATEADAPDFEARARLAPETAARAILRGVQKDREVIVVGLDARAAAMARRLAPNLTRRVLALAWQRLASNAKKVK
jgi:short-subunit dehydrogenase